MKKIFLGFASAMVIVNVMAQDPYPMPEFTNEVYLYQKDSAAKLKRLEKQFSKLDTKTKMGGFGGSETAYVMEGEVSTVRLDPSNLSFIFAKDAEREQRSTEFMDSIMKAEGYDPKKMGGIPGMGGADPSQSITLYKASVDKGSRKIYYMKTPGMFGGKKNMSSEKFSFSVKKIRDGYWELVIDKKLPRGEYAFGLIGAGLGNMDGSLSLFAFGVD